MVPESGTERETGGKPATLPLAWALHLSVDGLAKLRRRAYRKIADGQKESTD